MFVLGTPLQPSLILTIPADIGANWKGLQWTNTQAYCVANVNDIPNKQGFDAESIIDYIGKPFRGQPL